MNEMIAKLIDGIEGGNSLKASGFRNSPDFLDGKYDEMRFTINFDKVLQNFTVFEEKSEVLWDAAGGGGPTFSDEFTHQMTKSEVFNYLEMRLSDKKNVFKIESED